MRETDIKHENGAYWVGRQRLKGQTTYTVFKIGVTHSTSDSAYDDLSLAVARCDYLARVDSWKRQRGIAVGGR